MLILLSGGTVQRDGQADGGNQLAIRRRVQELKDQADGGSGMLTTNLTVIEGRDAKPHDILGPAMSPPFLAPMRLVIVEGLMNRFEPRPEQRAPRSVDAFNPLFAGLEQGMPPTTALVFVDGTHVKSNPMGARLAKIPGAVIEDHPEMKKDELLRYIRDEGAARSLRFRAGPSRRQLHEGQEREPESDPVALVAALTKGDTLAIANELDKLSLYTMGAEVTVDVVAEVCAGDREANNFDFVDGVMDGDLKKAFAALEMLRRDGATEQELLGQLISAYRTMGQVIDLLEDGAPPEQIGFAIKRPWPNLRDRAIARARRLGPAGLRKAYEAMIEADRTNKMGEVDEDLTTEVLIARLWQIAPARR
ncbi:MAG: hypothetical protein HY875_14770 [Chloroflexi bacterium]|nr:hypothetical protein [Chloroflexota bacterium]